MKLPEAKSEASTEYSDSELQSAENLMYHDTPLTPKMISSLMHVDASMQNTYYHADEERKQNSGGVVYIFGVLILSLIVAGVIGVAFLYFHGIGPFYDPVEASII
jgi:hypothetical protein